MEIDFSKYLPLGTAIISASIVYWYSMRSKKGDRLIQFTQDNLREIYSPIYHEMKKIINKSICPKDRERMLDSFFDKYSNINTSIYKLGNIELLNSFYDLQEKFAMFKPSRDLELWRNFWWEFENLFFYKISQGYKNSIALLYREFNWQQHLQISPYWKKIYLELVKFLFDTAKGSNVALLFIEYLIISSNIFAINLFPRDSWKVNLKILGLSVLFTLILKFANLDYSNFTSNPQKGVISKSFEKYFPRVSKWWKNMFITKRSYNKVPEMDTTLIHKEDYEIRSFSNRN
ncbi:hypothetical protein [Gorillibacterium sp. sgz500922]|uniref:hypothetical protein n=1 Tax=Gorillibacterium sp. sgz500922 TaxID=3446694 RepID=UPI003F67CD50